MTQLDEAQVLFRGAVANGETRYIELPIHSEGGNSFVGAQVAWLDATSSATITLELSSYRHVAAAVAGNAWEWKDSGLTFTGPSGAAAGSLLVNVENVRQQRARLKIVGAAASTLDIRDGAA